MFICGNDEAAKKTVSGILDQFGWETADMGKAEAARAIEPLCILWCIPGFLRNDWVHAFKLLTSVSETGLTTESRRRRGRWSRALGIGWRRASF